MTPDLCDFIVDLEVLDTTKREPKYSLNARYGHKRILFISVCFLRNKGAFDQSEKTHTIVVVSLKFRKGVK